MQKYPRVARTPAMRSAAALAMALLTAAPLVMAAETQPACDGSPGQVRLQVRVTGVTSTKGNITITLYPDDSDRFLAKGGKLARQRVPALMPLTEACFAVPAAGSYAVAVYHDANDDHDFNRTFVGMPAEGYGFSNNAVTVMGLPALKDVRFAAKAGDNPVYIKLRY